MISSEWFGSIVTWETSESNRPRFLRGPTECADTSSREHVIEVTNQMEVGTGERLWDDERYGESSAAFSATLSSWDSALECHVPVHSNGGSSRGNLRKRLEDCVPKVRSGYQSTSGGGPAPMRSADTLRCRLPSHGDVSGDVEDVGEWFSAHGARSNTPAPSTPLRVAVRWPPGAARPRSSTGVVGEAPLARAGAPRA